MRNTYLVAIAVVLVAVAVVPAFAQTGRSMAMGDAVVGVADDSAAWGQNPAGLPHVTAAETSVSPIPSHVSGTVDIGSDLDVLGLDYSARSPDAKYGWGAGYWTLEYSTSVQSATVGLEVTEWGAGFGSRFGEQGLSWGVALNRSELTLSASGSTTDAAAISTKFNIISGRRTSASTSFDETLFDVGLMLRRTLPVNDLKVGLVARDVSDEVQTTYDMGVGVRLPLGLLIAADMHDVTDEFDSSFHLGAECPIPTLPALRVRAGSSDGDFCYGVGYSFGNVEVSLARQEADVEDMTAATAEVVF